MSILFVLPPENRNDKNRSLRIRHLEEEHFYRDNAGPTPASKALSVFAWIENMNQALRKLPMQQLTHSSAKNEASKNCD